MGDDETSGQSPQDAWLQAMGVPASSFTGLADPEPNQSVDPNAGQPNQSVDPDAGQPNQSVDPNAGQPNQSVDPDAGQPKPSKQPEPQPEQPEQPKPAAIVLRSITIIPDNPSMDAGTQQQFNAGGDFSNDTNEDITSSVEWSSSAPDIVSIDAKGMATAQPVSGTATITATKDGMTASTTVSVTASKPAPPEQPPDPPQPQPQPEAPVLQSLTVTPETASIAPGGQQQFSAGGEFSNGTTGDATKLVNWSSSAPDVVSVDANGLATARPVSGTAKITASDPNSDLTASAEVSVSAPPPVLQSLTIEPTDAEIDGGGDLQFKATGIFSDGSRADATADVSWTSSAPAIVAIDANGLATAKRVSGTAVIAATDANARFSVSTNVTVTGPTDPNDVLRQKAGTDTRIQEISVSVILAGGQVIHSDADQVIKTGESTTVTITVDTSRLTVRFDPNLQLVQNDILSTTVKLESVYFDYNNQSVGASWIAPNYANWWGDIGPKIAAAVEKNLIANIPKQMKEKGYNPFDDMALKSQLPGIAAKLLPSGSGSGPKLQTSNAKLHADVVLVGEVRKPPLSIPAGTSVKLDVELDGGVPDSLADAKISSVRMAFSGTGAHVNFTVMKTDIPAIFVHGATMSSGGRLSVDYVLATEAFESIFKLMIAEEALRSGHDVDPKVLDSRQPVLRALVDKEIETNIEPLLRETIRQNKNAIPGMDLAKAAGL